MCLDGSHQSNTQINDNLIEANFESVSGAIKSSYKVYLQFTT
jgi:hypothetical protein